MSKIRLFVVLFAGLLAASCATQADLPQPAPAGVTAASGDGAFPFQVPEGAQFVARARNAATIYRIQEGCSVLHSLNPESVVFFWTLEAGRRSGFSLSEDEGCR